MLIDYYFTFGSGDEAVTFVERNCQTLREAVERLEITGLEFNELTKVSSETSKTKQ